MTTVAAASAIGAAFAVLAMPALAAKPGGGSPGAAASCTATPNPVAVGATYTLTGSGLGAGTFVNVLISDSGGTSAWNLQADSTGRVELKTWSYWAGTTKVTMQKSARHGWTTLATCSFSVV